MMNPGRGRRARPSESPPLVAAWRPVIYQNIQAARDALAGMVGEGLFARERSVGFEVLYHFVSIGAWLAYRTERGTKTG